MTEIEKCEADVQSILEAQGISRFAAASAAQEVVDLFIRRGWQPPQPMDTTYEAYRYAADGHAGEQVPDGDSDGAIIATGTREECMAAIRKRLGSGFEHREWVGQFEDVAAYSESDAEGCGGYGIRPVGSAS